MPRKASTDRKFELLHVAATEFAARGYPGASMRRIAARCGVKPAALYYWFPSKSNLLEAICRYGIGEFVQRLEAVVALALPAEERVRRAVRAHLEPLLEKRFYVHAFLFQRRDLPRRARYPLDAQSRAYEALWCALLEEGKREGTIPATLDSPLAVRAVLGMCNSVARWPHAVTDVSLAQVAETFTRLICHGLFEREVAGRAGPRTQRARTRRRTKCRRRGRVTHRSSCRTRPAAQARRRCAAAGAALGQVRELEALGVPRAHDERELPQRAAGDCGEAR